MAELAKGVIVNGTTGVERTIRSAGGVSPIRGDYRKIVIVDSTGAEKTTVGT